MRHHVVLIPGFFAFGDLGELTYFAGVRDVLERCFGELGLEVEVTEVKSLPTASIRKRAARVFETLAEVAARQDDPIHLVGHSTGGLDARLAVAPTAQLDTDVKFDAFDRVHTLTTICAPHHGSPLATVVGSAMGKPLLQLLALAGHRVVRGNGLPLKLALKLQRRWSKFDDHLGMGATILDQINEQLLDDLTDERREAILELLDGISTDQALLFQLTSAGCDMLNASTGDPDGIRAGCVVARAAKPRLRTIRTHGRDIFAQTLHAVYAGMHAVASRAQPGSLPEPYPDQKEALQRFYGEVPSTRDNDGVVPTLSQLWGEVIHATDADHLDVVGHYGRPDPDRIYVDWLPTGTNFDGDRFEALWGAIARFIADEVQRGERGESRKQRWEAGRPRGHHGPSPAAGR